MVLSEADAELFYEIFFPLLSYVNIKKKVIKGLKAFDRNDHINDTDAHQIAQKLWDDPAIIDRYISDNKDKLNEEKIEILQGFKRAHRGMFFVERILKKGAVLIGSSRVKGEGDTAYLVSGIISEWDELTGYMTLPVGIQCTLLPFKGVIIPDGLIYIYPGIFFGPGIRSSLKDTYNKVRKTTGLVTTL